MCNEQTGLNYQATVENQNKIKELSKQMHDKEMYIEEVNTTLCNRISNQEETIRRLEQEIEQLRFRERHPR